MVDGEFHVFISAVTSEFGKARDALAADLRARGLTVKIQSDFRKEADADTTLRHLHDYIRKCSAVICLIGRRSGDRPSAAAALPFADMRPDQFAQATYTQWEFFFARYYASRISLQIANEDCVPDLPRPTGADFPELQQAFTRHVVEEQDLYRSYFSNIDQLARAVLKEDWPKVAVSKPRNLPYPSIGKLFKGRDAFLKRMHESLTRSGGGRTAIVSKALFGLGGIGKTRAAIEYAIAHEADYSALLFVIADTPEALRRNLAALTGALIPSLNTTDDELRLRAAIDWLKTNPGWFLILDNLDTKEAMVEAERLMGQLTGGHVVMTSRLANFAAHVEALELDVLTVEDATALLIERTSGRRPPASDDATRARELAVDLGQLALALEHAAAHIAERQWTFAQI